MCHALNWETNLSEVKISTEQLFANHFYDFCCRASKFAKNSLVIVGKPSIIACIRTSVVPSKSRGSEIYGLFQDPVCFVLEQAFSLTFLFILFFLFFILWEELESDLLQLHRDVNFILFKFVCLNLVQIQVVVALANFVINFFSHFAAELFLTAHDVCTSFVLVINIANEAEDLRKLVVHLFFVGERGGIAFMSRLLFHFKLLLFAGASFSLVRSIKSI